MIAALPMYNRAETAGANDQLWTAIHQALRYGPQTLTRDMDVWDIWHSPDLLLAQTCGYPYRARLHGHVTLIGTPDYGVPDCMAGYYNSVFIARRDDSRRNLPDFDTATFAYNEPMSQSGWAAPMAHMDALSLTFGSYVQSGAHVKSAQMVANNHADIAAIDAVTWAMIENYDDFASELHIIAKTTPTPGLPYIAAARVDKPELFSAIAKAISALPSETRNALLIKGIVDIPAGQYLAIPTPDAPDQHIS